MRRAGSSACRSVLLALLLCALGLSWPATAEAGPAFYDNTAVMLPRVRADRASTYRRSVVAALARGKIRSVSVARGEARGRARRLAKRGDGERSLSKLPLAGIAAVAYTASPRFRGSELDMLVDVKGKGLVAVSLWHDPRGNVVVSVGKSQRVPPRFASVGKAGRAELAKRFGTGSIKGRGARWKDSELRVLAGALALLDRKERRVLRGVDFLRAPAGRGGARGAGHYFWGTSGYQLVIYNRAFVFDKKAFLGRAEEPQPFSAGTMVHEVGHAIASWPARRLIESGDVRKAQKMARGGPVLKEYARRRGSRRGPTRYGRSNLAESFAESFALHKLDPAALHRWSPEVADWFESGGHIEAMDRR